MNKIIAGCSPINYDIGDKVRVHIPNPEDPDNRYHEKTGEITNITEDDLSTLTGDPCHDYKYTVEFEDDDLDSMHFRYDDLTNI